MRPESPIRLPAAADSGVRAVAFDLDGTLVHSALDFDAMRAETGCPPGMGLLEYLGTLTDPDAVCRGHRVIERHELAGARDSTWMPGAQSLLAGLRALGLPTAILTRNMRPAVELVRERLGLDVDVVVTREDCAPKPSPDGLHRIADALSVPVRQLVYVGDFLYDLQAARAAGALACLYLQNGNAHYAGHADWVVSHHDQLGEWFRQRYGG